MAGKKGKTEAKSQAKGDGPKATKGKGKQDSAPADKGPAKKKGAQAISARHILCDKHSKREEALAELRSGCDWKDVCVKYSTEKARSGTSTLVTTHKPSSDSDHYIGGDLGGFKQKGSLQPEFEEVAFAMDTVDEHKNAVRGEKEPMKSYNYGLCKTVFGYHIILLEAKK